MADEEALNPTARSPSASIAALPIQRQVLSGWYVLCWTKPGVPVVALLISYQRMPPIPPESTLMLPTSASWPSAKRRYALRNMLRSPSVSSVSLVPAWGTQPPQITVKGEGVSVPACVKVEFDGVLKSAWKRQSFQVGLVPISVNGFGAPAAGWFSPSMSAGISWSSISVSLPVLTIVAGLPASMAARLSANGCGPRNAVPPALKTLMLM